MIEELSQLSQKSLTDLLAARDRVEAIRNEFHAIGSLPREKAADLQKQFRLAIDKFEKAIQREQAKARAGAWDALLAAYDKIRDYRFAIVQGQEVAEHRSIVEDVLQQNENWPKSGLAALQHLLSKIESNGQKADQGQQQKRMKRKSTANARRPSIHPDAC